MKVGTCLMLLVMLGLAMGSVACSNRQAYEALKIKQKNDCQRLPPSEYEECMKRAEQSYEKYKQQRDAVVNSDK